VFLDVRGFSSFAGIAESTDTAEFLKSVYLKILDEYFPDADFFKPTGDGLMILSGYDRETLSAAVCNAASTSIRLVEAFPEMCADDPMVNFDVPTKLGVGLARGSATSLATGEKVLDFSGRPLNLAARLMDLARPSGVVFDDSFGFELLPEELRERFAKSSAYVKGLAEAEPLTVFYLGDHTEIPEYNRSPMNRFKRFAEAPETITFNELQERGPRFRHPLKHSPAKKNGIEVHIHYPRVRANKTKHPTLYNIGTATAEYGNAAGREYGLVDYSTWIDKIRETGVKGPWKLTLTVEYSVIDGPGTV
jgi:class 3 adenylate cyclase